MRKRLNKKGFTLIELIVVIAVIGILVLLAAPRFLGYTRDAHVSAMKADAKILSNAALVYHIDNEVNENPQEWPVAYTAADKIDDTGAKQFTVTKGEGADKKEITVKGLAIDPVKLDKKYIKNLKNNIEDYVIVVEAAEAPELEGEVFFLEGSKDRLGKTWVSVDLQLEDITVTP